IHGPIARGAAQTRGSCSLASYSAMGPGSAAQRFRYIGGYICTVNRAALRPGHQTKRTLFRSPTRCDDLIGRLARELGHVIELKREAADAGRGRAHLDDQVPDFGFRHHGAHHIPTGPSVPRVEAEDLPAAT